MLFLENSVDLEKPADLDLHCFQLRIYLSRKITFDIKLFFGKVHYGFLLSLGKYKMLLFPHPWYMTDDIPSQMKVLNMVIPILRAFYSFLSN